MAAGLDPVVAVAGGAGTGRDPRSSCGGAGGPAPWRGGRRAARVPRHQGELCPPPILPRCLSRCPDPGCPTAVVQDLVDAAADGADKDRYAPVRARDEEAEVGASAIQCDEKRYVVLIEDDVHDRQGEDTRGGRRGAVRPSANLQILMYGSAGVR